MARAMDISVEFYRRCEAGHGGNLPAHKIILYANLYPLRERYAAISRLCGEPSYPEEAQKKWDARIDAMSPEERAAWESMLTPVPDKPEREKTKKARTVSKARKARTAKAR